MYGSQYTSSFKPPNELVTQVQKLAKATKSGHKYVDIPYVKATEDTLDGYGEIVKDFERRPVHVIQWPSPGPRGVSGGCDGGITMGAFNSVWENDHCYVKNMAVGGDYHNGWREGNDVFFQDANYHPDGEQIFWPVEKKPFILILSKHPEDKTVTPLDFVAFYFDATFGFAVKPGVYHLAVFPMADDNAHLISKQGKVHGVVLTDFLKEFGVFCRIPDALRRIPPSQLPKLNRIHPKDVKEPTQGFNVPRSTEDAAKQFSAKTLTAAHDPTQEDFKSFGRLLQLSEIPEEHQILCLPWPSKSREVYLGNEGGIRSTTYTMEWDQSIGSEANDLIIHGAKRKPAEAGCIYKAHTYHIDKLKSRIDGETLLYSLEEGDFLLLVAESEDNGEPLIPSFRAFSLTEKTALLLKPGIWFAPPVPFRGSRKMTFQETFSAVNARLEISLAKDAKSLVKIKSSG